MGYSKITLVNSTFCASAVLIGIGAFSSARADVMMTGIPSGMGPTAPHSGLDGNMNTPYVPPVPGTTLQGVFVFRTLDDCRNITDYALDCRRAVVIGGGLLGLEAAKGLMTHNLEEVTVVEVGPWLMGVQLDEAGGRVLQETIERLGIQVRTSTPPEHAVKFDEALASQEIRLGGTSDHPG